MNSPNFDHLFYFRITEACNLHCDHCFIPNNPKKINKAQLSDFIRLIKVKAKPGSIVLIQFHGGEPTIAGVDNLEWWANAILSELPNYKVRFRIQTNLYLDPRLYLRFIQQYCDNEIGVSWDFKIRKTKTGHGDRNASYEDTFWENHRFLLENGIVPFFVITGTKPFFEWAIRSNAMINWAKEKGVSLIHIERLTKVGNAVDTWSEIGVTNIQHSLYMTNLLRQYKQAKSRGQNLHISPFDGLLESVRHMDSASSYGCHSGHCDSRFHTFDAEGYKFGCTALNSTQDIQEKVIRIIDPKNNSFSSARKLRQGECENCEFKIICSSGCMATDVEDGSGECSGGKILFNALKSIVERESCYA